jgi:hypothetical protein
MEIFKLHGIKISSMGLCSYKGSINTVKRRGYILFGVDENKY